jgi:hypothetical protein
MSEHGKSDTAETTTEQFLPTLITVLERFVPDDDTPAAIVTKVIEKSVEYGLSYSEAAEREGVKQTPALTATFLTSIIANWESWGANYCATRDPPETRIADHADETVPLARAALHRLARCQVENDAHLIEDESFLSRPSRNQTG